MNKSIMNQTINTKRKLPLIQSGIALPIVLIFLVVMLLLGVTAIRNVTLGEKMAGNQRNQQLAFQAAERALRYCENAVQGTVPSGGSVPVLQQPTTPNLWEVATNWSSAVSVAVPAVTGDGLATEPRCMVENVVGTLKPRGTEVQVDPSIQAYRVTARGTGGTDNAVVMLQSYLKFN